MYKLPVLLFCSSLLLNFHTLLCKIITSFRSLRHSPFILYHIHLLIETFFLHPGEDFGPPSPLLNLFKSPHPLLSTLTSDLVNSSEDKRVTVSSFILVLIPELYLPLPNLVFCQSILTYKRPIVLLQSSMSP